MRIAMIGQKGIPCTGGGIERHVEDLSRHLAASGHEVTVYTRPHYTPAHKKSFHGVSLVSIPSVHTKHFDAISHSFFASLHAIAKGYDIIHYHGVGPALCSILPRSLAPHIRVVGTYHCDDWKQEKWGLTAKIILRLGAWMMSHVPHHTIAVSQEIYESLRASGARASYIPTGVTLNAKRPSRALLSRFRLTTSPYILVVSRFVRHKSIHDAIEAFKLLKSNGDARLRQLKLVLVGGGAFTNEYLEELKRRAEGHNDIVFTGYQSGAALEALFAHSSLFLQPSAMEGRSIALLEAMAWGVPVAAANIRESREVLLKNGVKLGSLFTLHSHTEIAALMRASLLTPRRLQHMASSARQRVIAEYDWKKIIPLVDDLYVRLAVREMHSTDLSFALEG